MIKETENILIGGWIKVNDHILKNLTSQRIDFLVSNYLLEISTDSSGWKKLFQDPNDKRFWELSFLDSSLHGGGSAILKCISSDEVKLKY